MKTVGRAHQLTSVSNPPYTTSPTPSRSNTLAYPPRAPTKKALLIGIEYWDSDDGTVLKINSAHSDVDAWFGILTCQYGYQPEDVVRLRDIDGAPVNTWPTYNNIKRELERLATDVQPGDKRFLFFACHGVQVEVTSDQQELDGKDEGIVTREVDNILHTLKDNLIRRILVDSIPSGASLTAVADTCHSGTLLDLPWEVKFDSSGNPKTLAAVRAPSNLQGSIISISACKDSQESQQLRGRGDNQKGIGVLTYQFSRLMATAQPGTTFTIPDIVARLTSFLNAASKPQHPVITCGKSDRTNFVFDP